MDDKNIVQLYWDRSEQAIVETDSKYGAYCYSIAYNALEESYVGTSTVSVTVTVSTFVGAVNLPTMNPATKPNRTNKAIMA